MQTPSGTPTPSRKDKTTADSPRRIWQRPTLQRLHVSLDTAESAGSGSDGGQTGNNAGKPLPG